MLDDLNVINPIEELNQRREQIARYDRETLEMMTLVALKKLAVNIVPSYAKLKKPNLIDALIEATKAEKVLASLIPDISIDVIQENWDKTNIMAEDYGVDLATWSQSVYNDYRNIIDSNYKNGEWNSNINSDLSTLAARIIRYLDEREGCQPNGKLAFTTKLRYRTHICNAISNLIESEAAAPHYKQLEACKEILFKAIKFQIKDTTYQKKGLQERRLAERKKEKEKIDFKPIYEFAEGVLLNLKDLKSYDWKQVSTALAIVTGRRMAELHLSTTTFKYVDERHIEFTGQLKTKGAAQDYFDKNPSYVIPVLVDAQLVVDAHLWMKNNKKVVDTAQAASTRYSVDLSAAMRVLRKLWGIEHELFSYKALRTVYAQVCNQLFNPDPSDNMLFLADILGHSRGDFLRGDNLVDTKTPQSYNSDFIVYNYDFLKVGS